MNANHRRKITAVLTLIDRRLCLFEGWAGGDACRSVFYVENNDLGPATRARLQESIARIRQDLAVIKEELALEIAEQEVSESIWSECSELWTSLAEIDSRRLRGYGELSREAARQWDPKRRQLERLLVRVLELAHGAEGGYSEGESSG